MLRSTAALRLGFGLAVALMPLNVCGLRLDRARLGHAGKGLARSSPNTIGRGLFVPKPSRQAGRQHSGTSDLRATVYHCPLVSVASGRRCYSVGYSAGWPRSDDGGCRLDTHSSTVFRILPLLAAPCGDHGNQG